MSYPVNSLADSFPYGLSPRAPRPVAASRVPASTDVGYDAGTVWLYQTGSSATATAYVNIQTSGGSANWQAIGGGSSQISTITGDSGGALSPTAGNINILGTALQIATTGSGSTLTISIPATFSIGSVSGAAGGTISVGTGNFLLQGAAGSTITLGTGLTTGTILIGGTAESGSITLGSSSAANSVIIAGGSGASTLTIADVQTAGSVAMGSGMTTGTISIGGVGAQTGQVDISPGTGAQTVTLANGTGGVKTISIGNGTSGNAISIGSGNNTVAQGINIANGAAGADSTVNFFGTASTAGVQTFNVFGSGATRAGAVNICTGAAAHVCTIGSLTGAAQLVLQSGTAGISLATGATAPGSVSMTPAVVSSNSTPATLNARVGQVTYTGFTTAAAGTQEFVISNTLITATSQSVFVSVTNLGTNDARMSIQRVELQVGAINVYLVNNGAAALNGDVLINFWIIN